MAFERALLPDKTSTVISNARKLADTAHVGCV